MNIPNTAGEMSNPLGLAVSARDAQTLQMVRQAIAAKQVRMAFQMVVSGRNPEKPAFCEGLVRVLDQTGRVIPARDFIQVLETDEMGRQLDVLALEIGLNMLETYPGLRLSINLNANSVGYPAWKTTLLEHIQKNRTIAERLILEISEHTAYAIPELVRTVMEELHLLGVTFALDNFGRGFTSLSHLRDMYFDIIKIDGSLTKDLAQNPDNRAMAKALLSMAHALETYVIAEHVETREDAETLITLGYDGLQGYFFGAPTLKPEWLGETICCNVG